MLFGRACSWLLVCDCRRAQFARAHLAPLAARAESPKCVRHSGPCLLTWSGRSLLPRFPGPAAYRSGHWRRPARARGAALTAGRARARQGAGGPVHAVMAENWLVYHYWSSANARFQVWLRTL